MKLSPKLTLPITVIVVGFVAAGGMIAARPKIETTQPERLPPLVRVQVAVSQNVQLTIEARGSVVPRTESELVSEVSGRIIWVSPSLSSGGFLEPGDMAIRIDARDYEVALVRAEAGLSRATSELEFAHTHLERHNRLQNRGVSSQTTVESAMNAAKIAVAIEQEARASRDQAQRDLDRTEVRAPFAGRVRETHVNVGQFVARGAPVARIYAVDYAEIKLPIPDADAAFVELPIAYRGADSSPEGPVVLLRSRFAGADYMWRGRILRTDGELDPRTRMIQAIARVEDPYGRGEDPSRPPLSVGLFVEAEILGRRIDDVIVLPRSALRGASQVAVVDEQSRLRLRDVDILKLNRGTIVLRAGIEAGEQVCTSPLAIMVDGMEVRTTSDEVDDTSQDRGEEQEAAPVFAGYRSVS